MYMIDDMYVFRLCLYQDNMVYQYVFHNDDYQEEKHNQFYKMYMIIHLMRCNSDMFHDMEDILINFLKDKILLNMKIHKHDIEDREICLLYHMIYIDQIVVHYMLNILNHTIDSYEKKKKNFNIKTSFLTYSL